MKRRVFSTVILLTLASLAAAAAAVARTDAAAAGSGSGARVRSVHLASAAAAMRVTFDLSAATSSAVASFNHPARILVDFKHAHLAVGTRLPRAGGDIKAIRVQQRAGGGLRFVLLLSRPMTAASQWQRQGRAREFVVRLALASIARTHSPAAAPARTEHAYAGRAYAASFVPAPAAAAADLVPRPVLAAHAPRDTGRDVVIAVDAGHGGVDPGATGRDGTHEKDVVLAIARALAQRLDAEPGMRAVLTRDRDEFLTLRERIRRARVAKADLFVSVHADSIADSAVTGSSVYVLSERGATNEAARWLAERENAADLMGGVSLADKGSTLASVLLDLSQQASISASMTAAQQVLDALQEVGTVRKLRVQQAGFVVLKSPDIPSMLIETAYISNPIEEQRLRNPAHQRQLALAIFSGLRSYFVRNPPPGTRFAQLRSAKIPPVLAGMGATAMAAQP